LDGGPGNGDHVYGGLGADQVNGGPGDFDVVRGDEGFDHMDGGGGSHDIASFATDSPPGAGGFGFNGVYVDLPNGIAYGAGFGVGKTHGTDMLSNVEDVIGSPFDDKIVGDGQDNRIDAGPGNDTIDGGAGTNQVDGGPGSNTCSNYSQQGSICNRSSQPAPNTTYVGVGSALDGFSTVFVVGGAADDQIQVLASGSAFTVSDSAGLTTDASSLTPAGTGCALDASATTATCVSSSISGIDSLALGGGAGADSISIDGSVPRTLAAYLDGGDGNDVVNGGPEDDFIQGGESGQDMLDGGGGDDSLQSDTGADVLSGGPGDDLMVVDFACEGEQVSGGGGKDKVGFDPDRSGVSARIGGVITSPGSNICAAGQIANDVENLEGSGLADTLIGNGRANSLVGRGGNDTLIGKGGADDLQGGPGNDVCNGGGGHNHTASC
jgi:Ca2+-binding RTX toxin-like protein